MFEGDEATPWVIRQCYDVSDPNNVKPSGNMAIAGAGEAGVGLATVWTGVRHHASMAAAHAMKAAPEMLAELRNLEWRMFTFYGGMCPTCNGIERDGHKAGCTLRSALDRAEGKS